MDDATRDEIDRVVGNCFYEPHPFKAGAAGMIEICRAKPLIDKLSDEEMETFFFPHIDQLLDHLKDCFSCSAKLCVLAVLFSRQRPGMASRYEARLNDHLSRRRRDDERDYGAEIREAMERYGPPGVA